MNCPKCGAANNSEARFCGSCGNDLSVSQQQTVMTQNQSNDHKKGTSKIIGIILAIIALAIVVVGIICLVVPSEEKQEKNKIDATFNPDKLIKVKQEDKYGYINTEGEFVIEATYETATDFIGDYAIVRAEVESNGLKKIVYQIIDQKGKVKKQSETEIEYIQNLDLWIINNELHDASMKRLSPKDVKISYESDNYFIWFDSNKNTAGIMNEKGEKTYTYNFKDKENYISIEPSNNEEELKEKYCTINIENEKYAIVNCNTGVVVHDFTENYVSPQGNNIYIIKNHDTWNFVETMYIQGDKKAYSSTDENIKLYYYTGYVSIRDNSKSYSERYKYLHTSTLKIKDKIPEVETPEESEKVDEWEKLTNNKKFSCNTRYGLMSGEKITLPCEWDDLEYVEVNLYKYLKEHNKEYIYGEKDNKWYLIDLPTKKGIIEFNSSYIIPKEATTFMYYTDTDTNNKKVFNLLTGNSLNVDKSKTLTIYSNYVTVKDSTEKTLKYYNTALKLIYTENL